MHTATLETVVVFGHDPGQIGNLQIIPSSVLDQGEDPNLPRVEVQPWEIQSIVYTSGTTGPSKGVMSSYAHLYAMSGPQAFYFLTAEDRYMCNLPLFHVGGTVAVMGMLWRGGSIAMVPAFSTEEFWRRFGETGTTFVLLLGAMTNFITKRPPGPEDRDHPLKKVIIAPLPEDVPAFAERFGVAGLHDLQHDRDIVAAACRRSNPAKAGTCGRPRPGVEVAAGRRERLRSRARRSVGEMLVRTDAPWAMNSGYYKNPEATAQSVAQWLVPHRGCLPTTTPTASTSSSTGSRTRSGGAARTSPRSKSRARSPPIRWCNEVAVIGVPSELSEDEMHVPSSHWSPGARSTRKN